MKLLDMIDQTPPHRQNYWKTCSNEKTTSKLDIQALAQKSRSLQKAKDNNLGNKKMPTLKKLSRDSPSN